MKASDKDKPMIRFSKAVFAILLIVSSSSFAQGLGNSPYSTFGVGEVLGRNFAQYHGMGGSGVSVANGIYTNSLNPALLAVNKFTVFEVGLLGNRRLLKDKDESQKAFGANLHYLNLTFPFGKKASMSIGMQPYSTVDYESRFVQKARGSEQEVIYSYKGEGAINKATWALGYNPVKSWYIGTAADFYFGNILRKTTSTLKNDPNYQLNFNDRTSTNGAGFRAGTAWKQKIKKELFLNFGATYELKTNIKTSNLQTSQAYAPDASGGTLPDTALDTLGVLTKGTAVLPPQYRIGFSLEKPYKFTISADYAVQKWSQYRMNGLADANFKDAQTIAIGGEYTPNANAAGFFKKTTYRLGYSNTTTQYFLNNQQIKDNSISAGLMIPLGRSLSYANISVVAGQRGNINVVEEKYLKMVVGFTLNDRWFYKVKID
jgi:hypothetical protein